MLIFKQLIRLNICSGISAHLERGIVFKRSFQSSCLSNEERGSTCFSSFIPFSKLFVQSEKKYLLITIDDNIFNTITNYKMTLSLLHELLETLIFEHLIAENSSKSRFGKMKICETKVVFIQKH